MSLIKQESNKNVPIRDLKNAFGEVHHNLIPAILKYHRHRNSRTRTLAASVDISDPWRSKMVPIRPQNDRGLGDQLTRDSYWLSYASYLITKFGSRTGQRIEEKCSIS